MRKKTVIVLAVAIIGALGVYGKGHSKTGSPPASAADTAVQSASTMSTASSRDAINSSTSGFKDGTYTGATENTVYGDVQVSVVVSGGKIIDVNFLQMPDDRGHTQEVTAFAEPLLKHETLQKQSAHIDFVSGATQTSEGYEQSLQSALDQAA